VGSPVRALGNAGDLEGGFRWRAGDAYQGEATDDNERAFARRLVLDPELVPIMNLTASRATVRDLEHRSDAPEVGAALLGLAHGNTPSGKLPT